MGESVRKYMLAHGDYQIDAVDTMGDPSRSTSSGQAGSGQVQGKAPHWKNVDLSQYDVVYHVAGIAHVNADLLRLRSA